MRHKINVSSGIAVSRIIEIIGLYFFASNINGNNFLESLQQTLVPAIQALQLSRHLIGMQDGGPAHGSAEVTAFFNNAFGNNWIEPKGLYK